jgi:hypothetical protein
MSGSGLQLNAGSGGAQLLVDTDSATSIDAQVVKIGFSATTATPIQVSTANPLPVTQPTQADGATFTRSTTTEVVVAGAVDSSAPSLTAGKSAAVSLDTAGNLRVNVAAGAAASGTVSAPSAALLSNTPILSTAPGTSRARVYSAASTNATSVKGSGGILASYTLSNSGTTGAWVKFYDTASAPTAGSGTPAFDVYLAPGATVPDDKGASGGIPFTTGIGYTITGVATDADTTAVAAAQVQGVLVYK